MTQSRLGTLNSTLFISVLKITFFRLKKKKKKDFLWILPLENENFSELYPYMETASKCQAKHSCCSPPPGHPPSFVCVTAALPLLRAEQEGPVFMALEEWNGGWRQHCPLLSPASALPVFCLLEHLNLFCICLKKLVHICSSDWKIGSVIRLQIIILKWERQRLCGIYAHNFLRTTCNRITWVFLLIFGSLLQTHSISISESWAWDSAF